MAIHFEHRNGCPICRYSESTKLCEIPYTHAGLNSFVQQFYQGRVDAPLLKSAIYRVVSCDRCGFIYQDSFLNAEGMAVLYEDWIDHKKSLNKKKKAQEKLNKQYSGQVQTLQRIFSSPPDQIRILDFGMGWGYWSRVAQAQGFDVSGFELSTQRSQHAQAMGLTVISELPQPGPRYDCIYASQVFEHLADPLGMLITLCERLSPKGIVYIRVPDGRGVAARLKQQGWSAELDAIHPLEHINCFTRKTLLRMAHEADLIPFNPPIRLNWRSFWGGLRREVNDRYLNTHLFLKRNVG